MTQPIPPLAVDPGLAAAAQSWSAHLATAGAVQDLALAGCGSAPTAGQVCELAGNSGNSGNGLWPGDGSDGMESAYMSSPVHRQNMLNAGYDEVGIGVTCSGGEAWTVEVFGFSYGSIGPAQSRQAAQLAVAGNPVPPLPTVAGTQTGDPVYCPGQTVGPDGRTTSTGGQYPYPSAVPSVPGEPVAAPVAIGIAAAAGDRGYWVARSDGSVTALGAATDFGSMAGQRTRLPRGTDRVDAGRKRLLAGGIGRWGLLLRRRRLLRLDRGAPPQRPDRRDGADGRRPWLLAGGLRTVGCSPSVTRPSPARPAALPLNAPIVGMASTADGRGYWLVGSDGGVFAFGDARFKGSMAVLLLEAPVVGMAADRRRRRLLAGGLGRRGVRLR